MAALVVVCAMCVCVLTVECPEYDCNKRNLFVDRVLCPVRVLFCNLFYMYTTERMELERLDRALAQSRRSEREMADEVTRLEADVQDAKQRAKTALIDLEHSRATIHQLQTDLDTTTANERDLRVRWETAEQDMTRLQAVVSQTSREPVALRTELDAVKADLKQLGAAYDEAKRESVALQASLQTAEGESNAHHAEVQRCTAAMEVLQASLTIAEETATTTAQDLQGEILKTSRLESELRDAQQRCGTLEQNIAASKAEATRLQAEVHRLNDNVHVVEAAHKDCPEQVLRLQTAAAAEQATRAALQVKLDDLKHKHATQTEALERAVVAEANATAAVGRGDAENQALQHKLTAVEGECTRLRDDVQLHATTIAGLNTRLTDTAAEAERLQSTLEEHRAQADDAQAALDALVGERETLATAANNADVVAQRKIADMAQSHATAVAATQARLQELEGELSVATEQRQAAHEAATAERAQLQSALDDATSTTRALETRLQQAIEAVDKANADAVKRADDKLAQESADAIAKVIAREAAQRDALVRQHVDRATRHTQQHDADQRRIAVRGSCSQCRW